MADTTKRFVADLITDSHGAVLPTLSNLSRIFDQDEALNGIVYNEMNGCIDTVQELPWRATPGGWGQNDFACLELYLEKNYGVYAPARCRVYLHHNLLRALQIWRETGLFLVFKPVSLITVIKAYLEAEIRHIAEHLAVFCKGYPVMAGNHHCLLAELGDELLPDKGDAVFKQGLLSQK